MSGLEFDEAAAERLERMYLGPDIVAQREDTLARLAIQPGEAVLDIGSGPGFLCQSMADAVGADGKIRGIDVSPQMVARSIARNTLPHLTYAEGDAMALAEPDASYDAVVSTQVAEYLSDVDAFCSEALRVLRPGGRLLVIATDWDSVVWHTEDDARMTRMMKAFEAHCADSRLPRTLAPRLRRAGFEGVRAAVYPLVNLVFEEGLYGQGIAGVIRGFTTKAGLVDEAEADAWHAELQMLSDRGDYFFCSNRFVFECVKPG
jgi:ubiquinone/menaquinone biosynthesis C-methylase UbiE